MDEFMKKYSKRWLQILSIAGIAFTWISLTENDQKIRGLIFALSYALAEYIWTSLSTVDPDGHIRFTPFKRTRKGHATWGEFFGAAVVFSPFMIDPLMKINSTLIHILLFPGLIWLLEIIWGYYLLGVWGIYSWKYEGKDVYFHGLIKLRYWKQWMIVGILTEILYPHLII